jgi:glyoxylase-like metal-dependent hydrolase (beta-lactamase superfamily II)
MEPRIHHLNCATMCPYGARPLTGSGSWREPASLVAHVLLIEADQGLVLIDTGLGTADVSDPARTGGFFQHVIRPQCLLEETVVEQIGALGFDPADVRDIAVTHLDVDHAGGLGDFPGARVHVFASELDAALQPRARDRLRYAQCQWAHGPKWVPYEDAGDEWFGFGAVRAIEGLEPEILIVPLVGHSLGHSAIAVRNGDRWLLHCGDAYFHRGSIATPPTVPPALRIFESLVEADRKQRRANVERLRELASRHGEEIDLFCAHDPVELERLRSGG